MVGMINIGENKEKTAKMLLVSTVNELCFHFKKEVK